MKQVLQNLRTGLTALAQVPTPGQAGNSLLIATRTSLISAGTERMLVEFSKGSLLAKARSQPQKVQQVLDKIRSDGLLPTLETVFNRLDEPLPLGYCNAGVVLAAGPGVTDFKPGDRVASNGPHAEMAVVPRNLCARIPDNVTDEQAAFTVLSSIALQGIRLLGPTLGETFAVYGLGLIGLVAVQLLRACGCHVLGVDINPRRLSMAEELGARAVNAAGGDPVAAANASSGGTGIDGVLVTASAKTDDILHQSARMCRRRGRVVLVGVVGLNLQRADFYEKELSFQVSCSYGPGRYDERYEQGGVDYPLGFVRWTEQRNFQAVLGELSAGRLKVDGLITHRFPLDHAAEAYAKLSQDPSALGMVLQYPGDAKPQPSITISQRQPAAAAGTGGAAAVIGAGSFSKMTLMPALAKSGAKIAYVADLNGVAAAHLARKFDAAQAVTDYKLILQDPKVAGVLIAVGHNLHARFVCEALEAGKHVFVEKPLAMNVQELAAILAAAAKVPDKGVIVGFNRRFSPHVIKMKQLLASASEPLAMEMTINAGAIPPGHWVHDPIRGGGRIIGEACHFIDLLSHLCGSKVLAVAAHQMGGGAAVKEDKMSISLGFEDGSVGTVNYYANGSRSYPKETLTVFSEGRVLRLENFRVLKGYGFAGFKKFRTWRQDKGHAVEVAAWARWLAQGGPAIMPLDEAVNATLASFAAMTAAREFRTVALDREYAPALASGGTAPRH